VCLFSDTGCGERMDPMFLSYSQANGVPQESKLATYMVNYLYFLPSILIYFFLYVTHKTEGLVLDVVICDSVVRSCEICGQNDT
jgi:hypothetical protein